MKKTITRFLLLAMTVVGIGAMTSCKDYDGESVSELKDTNYTLLNRLSDQEKVVKDLQAHVDSCRNKLHECGGSLGDLTPEQQQELKDFLDELGKGGTNNKPLTSGNLADAIENDPALKEKLEDMFKCACDLGAIQAQINELKALVEKIQGVDPELVDNVAQLLKDYKDLESRLVAVEALSAQTLEDVKALATTVSGVQENVSKLEENVKGLQENVTKIEGDVEGVKKDINAVKDDLLAAKATAESANALAQLNSNKIIVIEGQTEANKARIDSLAQVTTTAQALIAEIDQKYAAQVEAVNAAVAANAANISDNAANISANAANIIANAANISANTTKISELNESVITLTAQYGEVSKSVEELKNDYTALKEEADELLDKVKKLTERVNLLEEQVNALAKQVTGITIQQVYNPAFGNISLPVGVNTNVLMALYGEASQDYVSEFPNRKFIDVEPVYTIKAQGQMLLDKKTEATAGKVYLTVNPSNVDFSGLTLDLVNSQNVNAPVQLSRLALSDKTLKFGYTRAGNNFYESEATVSKADIEAASLKIDKGAIASALKETVSAIKNRDASKAKIAAADMASVIYKTAQSLSLDAEAVKVTAIDTFGVRNVTSEYAIAACAIKPLMFNSFDALASKQLGNLPLYTQATNLINKVHDKVVSGIKRGYKKMNGDALVEGINNLTIHDIQLQELDENLVAKFRVEVSQTIDLAGRKIKFDLDKDVELPIHLTTKADLSGLTFNIPTIVVAVDGNGVISSDDKNSDAAVWVPIVDEVTGEAVTDPETGNPIGGYIPATNVTVKGNGEAKDVTVVAPDGTIVDIDFNETVKTHLSLKDVEITIPASDEFKFEFTQVVDLRDQIKDIFGTVQNQIGSVNNMLQDVRDVVDAARDLIDDINSYENRIIGQVDSYAARVQDYLDKINNKAVNGINKVVRNLPRLLQPTIMVNSDAGLVVAGFESAKPVATGKVQLIATSYTGELLCPFLAKVVTLNGQVQKIGEGGVIEATGVKPGVNVVKYAALDYSGVERDITYYFLYK